MIDSLIQPIRSYLDALPKRALRRITAAALDEWTSGNAITLGECSRCLVGHAEDWIPPCLPRDIEVYDLRWAGFRDVPATYDTLVEVYGLTEVVAFCQAAASQRLAQMEKPS